MPARPARALGIAERQPELPREVGAQKVRQVGAVGREPKPARLVLAEPHVVVEEVPRGIAGHLIEAVPARLGVERVVEELRDPHRKKVLGRPVPRARHRPDAAGGRAPARWGAHPQLGARLRAPGGRELEPVCAGSARVCLHVPPPGRAVVAGGPCGRQRHALGAEERDGDVVERVLGGGYDAHQLARRRGGGARKQRHRIRRPAGRRLRRDACGGAREQRRGDRPSYARSNSSASAGSRAQSVTSRTSLTAAPSPAPSTTPSTRTRPRATCR